MGSYNASSKRNRLLLTHEFNFIWDTFTLCPFYSRNAKVTTGTKKPSPLPLTHLKMKVN